MKKQICMQIFVFLMGLLECCALSGCSNNTVLSDTGGETSLCMEVSDYTGTLERTITIKNTQKGEFAVQLRPDNGKIEICIIDGKEETILSINEEATLEDQMPITTVISGNGTYLITVRMKQYKGSFGINWEVTED